MKPMWTHFLKKLCHDVRYCIDVESRLFSTKVQYQPAHDIQNPESRNSSGNNNRSAIPAAKGLPVFGTLLSLIMSGGSSNLHSYIDNRHKQLGPIFKESIGPVSAIFVSDPQMMRKIYSAEGKYPVHILPEAWVIYNQMYGSKRGLYFMNGEEWLNCRRILNRVLLTNYKNDDYSSIQNDVIDQWIGDWRKLVDKDIEIHETQFYRLSLSYVVASLIGSNYLKCRTDFNESINNLSNYVHSIFEESCKLNLIPAKLAVSLNLPPWKKFVKAVDSALNQGEEMVKHIQEVSSDDGLLSKLINENMPPSIISRVIVDLILAASDTTAFTTQWSIYLLSKHLDVQNQLGNDPDNSQLLKGIIKETLRLYPAAPFITRILPDGINLDGYHIPAGQLLIMSLYSSGRDPKFFPNPEKFWPQRWERLTSDNSKNLNEHRAVNEPNASQPFAMGLRSCVGRKLAESQMMLTLSKVASNFHLKSLQETEMTLHFVPVPKTPIRIHLSNAQW